MLLKSADHEEENLGKNPLIVLLKSSKIELCILIGQLPLRDHLYKLYKVESSKVYLCDCPAFNLLKRHNCYNAPSSSLTLVGMFERNYGTEPTQWIRPSTSLFHHSTNQLESQVFSRRTKSRHDK
ncbi:unnamed protein product [Ceratitis capitata]|uniref:(Mediterranean fruit fly) hypothetical protein n=1 Tax=Ceratitis capitata TaxID=7213 RepID=A0A811UVL0_CERCA|nr:unnamed protein product [Ceratitis capitata]